MYDANISTITSARKSMCDSGWCKHKRKHKKNEYFPSSYACACCTCVTPVHTYFFLCLCLCLRLCLQCKCEPALTLLPLTLTLILNLTQTKPKPKIHNTLKRAWVLYPTWSYMLWVQFTTFLPQSCISNLITTRQSQVNKSLLRQ